MNMDYIEQFIDLRRADIDPEVFAAALAIRHIRKLIASGGLDFESVTSPQQIEVFLLRAISTAQKTKRFEREWRSLQLAIPGIKIAWENGQAHFQKSLLVR
jgi:hypothetical protein